MRIPFFLAMLLALTPARADTIATTNFATCTWRNLCGAGNDYTGPCNSTAANSADALAVTESCMARMRITQPTWNIYQGDCGNDALVSYTSCSWTGGGTGGKNLAQARFRLSGPGVWQCHFLSDCAEVMTSEKICNAPYVKVSETQCKTCDLILANSVYSGGSCECAPGYTLTDGVCVGDGICNLR